MSETYTLVKAVRKDGRSFYGPGVLDWIGAIGQIVEIPDAAPASEGQCARGLHACATITDACRAIRGHFA